MLLLHVGVKSGVAKIRLFTVLADEVSPISIILGSSLRLILTATSLRIAAFLRITLVFHLTQRLSLTRST